MSNGISQNATSYTTASVQEEGLLALCSGHCSAAGRAFPTAVPGLPSTPGHSGAGPGPACAMPQTPALVQRQCKGGLSVPFPSPQAFSRQEEQNGFLGATTSPVPLPRFITGNMGCCNPL